MRYTWSSWRFPSEQAGEWATSTSTPADADQPLLEINVGDKLVFSFALKVPFIIFWYKARTAGFQLLTHDE